MSCFKRFIYCACSISFWKAAGRENCRKLEIAEWLNYFVVSSHSAYGFTISGFGLMASQHNHSLGHTSACQCDNAGKPCKSAPAFCSCGACYLTWCYSPSFWERHRKLQRNAQDNDRAGLLLKSSIANGRFFFSDLHEAPVSAGAFLLLYVKGAKAFALKHLRITTMNSLKPLGLYP